MRREANRDVRFLVPLLVRADGSIEPPTGWELALAYGDARGEALSLLETDVRDNPRSPRALRARQQLRRLKELPDAPSGGSRP